MNHDRAQLAKLGQTPPKTPTSLSAAHCVHCGRIYIQSDKKGSEDCACGAELYPVTKDIVLGEELRLADGYEARAEIKGQPLLEIDGYVDEKASSTSARPRNKRTAVS